MMFNFLKEIFGGSMNEPRPKPIDFPPLPTIEMSPPNENQMRELYSYFEDIYNKIMNKDYHHPNTIIAQDRSGSTVYYEDNESGYAKILELGDLFPDSYRWVNIKIKLHVEKQDFQMVIDSGEYTLRKSGRHKLHIKLTESEYKTLINKSTSKIRLAEIAMAFLKRQDSIKKSIASKMFDIGITSNNYCDYFINEAKTVIVAGRKTVYTIKHDDELDLDYVVVRGLHDDDSTLKHIRIQHPWWEKSETVKMSDFYEIHKNDKFTLLEPNQTPKSTWTEQFMMTDVRNRKLKEKDLIEHMVDVFERFEKYNSLAYKHDYMPAAPIKNFHSYKSFLGLVGLSTTYSDYEVDNYLRNVKKYSTDV